MRPAATRTRCTPRRLIPLAAAAALLPRLGGADFAYPDFAEAAGLALAGAAGFTTCARRAQFEYAVLYGVGDAPQGGAVGAVTTVGTAANRTAWAETAATAARVGRRAGGVAAGADAAPAERPPEWRAAPAFPHRDDIVAAAGAGGTGSDDDDDDGLCATRLRLTPARPGAAGAAWASTPVSLLDGFEAGFAFQVSAHSQACVSVAGADFGTATRRACALAGGDGLAFVVHRDPSGAGAVGGAGGGLGAEGLRAAVVVELDGWFNPPGGGGAPGDDADSVEGDDLADHVAVHASRAGRGGGAAGIGGNGGDPALTLSGACQLAPSARARLSDGLVHTARVAYWPHVRHDLLPHLGATLPALAPLLVDGGGEGRRVGTLAVFLDGSPAPAVAVLMNLNAAVGPLPDGRAWVGLTAGTGAAWAAHDVLSWYVCEAPGCGDGGGGA